MESGIVFNDVGDLLGYAFESTHGAAFVMPPLALLLNLKVGIIFLFS
jgi:hypothetical protein